MNDSIHKNIFSLKNMKGKGIGQEFEHVTVV